MRFRIIMHISRTINIRLLSPIFLFAVLLLACSLFDNKEKKAIEIVKAAKIQFDTENIWDNLFLGVVGLGQGATWQDFANIIVKKDPNKKYQWIAEKTNEISIYIVNFVDENGWGHRWEVNLEQQTVNYINQNEYLRRKYGSSRLDRDVNFEIFNIEINSLKFEKEYNRFSNDYSKKIIYIIKANVKNKTGRLLSSAEISGNLKVIFRDKTIVGESNWQSGFKSGISKANPWNPGTDKSFYIKTKGIEEIYLNYQPEYVFFEIAIKAEDPVGFNYDKNIEEYDLKDKWKTLNE